MSKKRSKLLAEPQPVFVGGCLTLIMLLMQFYVITVSSNGNIVPLFNSPIVLIGSIFSDDGLINPFLWVLQAVTPVLMLVFALIFGKKHAKLLVVASSLLALRGIVALLTMPFVPYHITYIIYIISFVFYFLTALEVIKTIKPFIIYIIALCLGMCLVSVLGLPPFVLFDKSLYLSDMIYFLAFHSAIANFARAIPIQKSKNK